jgi:hypothetical protein
MNIASMEGNAMSMSEPLEEGNFFVNSRSVFLRKFHKALPRVDFGRLRICEELLDDPKGPATEDSVVYLLLLGSRVGVIIGDDSCPIDKWAEIPILQFKEIVDFNIGDNEVKMLGWRFWWQEIEASVIPDLALNIHLSSFMRELTSPRTICRDCEVFAWILLD